MTFEEAVKHLKDGFKVTRKAWDMGVLVITYEDYLADDWEVIQWI